MELFFGWGLKFGSSSSAVGVAMNGNQEMALVHIPSGHQLAYRQGRVQHATVAWAPDIPYGDGREPAIAMSRTYALGVHRGVSDDHLYYELATLLDGNIIWIGTGRYDDGITPTIAINDSGVVLEVHQSQNTGRLWYNVGVLAGQGIDWNKKDDFADGIGPSVSMNNHGQAIVTYTRNNILYTRVLATDGKSLTIHGEQSLFENTSSPSVAITDEGWVVLCFGVLYDLKQIVGTINGTTISWGGEVQFDTGLYPAVAAQNGLALQVHKSEKTFDDEFFSTSLITDRSRWMTNAMNLRDRPLRDLVLPGSHDAGMYSTSNPFTTPYVQTQDKNLYQQLTYGLRWFHLRVQDYEGELYIHHGDYYGPRLSEVLDDIQKFMQNNGRELVILKFSHFASFTAASWNNMVGTIDARLGQWLHRGPLPEFKRLADLTLNDYGAAVLVVVDGNWAAQEPEEGYWAERGYWVYRNSTADDAWVGDLIVYDQYSKTEDYSTMRDEQIDQFLTYDGYCTNEVKTPCDLFLLSWTLTPEIDTVYDLAHAANPHCGDEVGKLPIANEYNKIINIVYVDYVQYARVSDVAIAEKYIGGANG